MTQAMTEEAVRDALTSSPSWQLKSGKLRREFSFADFSEALGFLVRVGVEAEKQGHHPEIANVYSNVTIELTTHDAGGITEKDFALARAIDEIAGS